jgi:carbon storage regulator
MLIVTRRKGQRIVIGHDIEIVITDISRSGVKIGIIAPTTLTIFRGEVKDAVEQANREALESSFEEPLAQAEVAPAPAPAAAAEATSSAVVGAGQAAALER